MKKESNLKKKLKTVIYKVDRKKLKKDEENLIFKQDMCTICLEAFKNGDKVKIMPQCQHVFHEKCCANWLHEKFRCPNCNIAIQFEEPAE